MSASMGTSLIASLASSTSARGSSSQALDPQDGHLFGTLLPLASQEFPHLLQA